MEKREERRKCLAEKLGERDGEKNRVKDKKKSSNILASYHLTVQKETESNKSQSLKSEGWSD